MKEVRQWFRTEVGQIGAQDQLSFGLGTTAVGFAEELDELGAVVPRAHDGVERQGIDGHAHQRQRKQRRPPHRVHI